MTRAASAMALTLGLAGTGAQAAPDYYAAADIGVADPSRGGFRDAPGWRLRAGLRWDAIGLELSYIDPDEMDLRGSADTFVDIEGYSLGAHYELALARVRLVAHAGVFFWEAKAVLNDRRLGDDRGDSALLGVGARLPLGRLFSFTAGWTRLNEVSGTDLDWYELGVRFDF